MVANPNVIDATAFYDGVNTHIMALFRNTGSYGWVQIQFMQGNRSLGASNPSCEQTKTFPWVYKKVFTDSGLIHPIDYVNAWGCNGTNVEKCSVTPPTCSDPILKSHFGTGGITPINANTTMPVAPTGLVVTPGNTSLNISWNKVPDPSGISEVFAYIVTINSGTTTILSEYVSKDTKNITIPNLSNGTTYTIDVSGLSHSNINGNVSSAIGTPGGTSAVGSVKFSSNPQGAEILIDNQDQNHITPFTITGVPVGTHNYRLKLKDHSDITGNVVVRENTIAQVSVDFTTGQVSIVPLIFGIGVAAVLIGGLIYALRESDTTRTTSIPVR